MSGGEAFVWVMIIVLVYFLPSIVAAGKPRNGGVLVVNLFLGWTLVGWVVALAWAVTLSGKDVKLENVGPSGEPTTISDTRRCPFCAEDIKLAAIVCKHCGRDLPREPVVHRDPRPEDIVPPPAAIP